MKITKNFLAIASFLLAVYNFNFAQGLNPGDGIKISFYNIQDSVKGKYFIDENGTVQLPYIGIVDVKQKDFTAIRSEILDGYSKIYRNPEINIQPLYRIVVLGEVGNPGIYYVSGYETLTDILSMAGGEKSDSDIDEILVIREETELEVDLESFLEGSSNLADIGIESGDKIFVPRSWWVGARDASIVVSGVAVIVTIASLFTN